VYLNSCLLSSNSASHSHNISLIPLIHNPSPHKPNRDGAIAVTHTHTARLICFCHDFTPAVTPLHQLVVSGDEAASMAAAAWLDRFVVFAAPWSAAAVAGGAFQPVEVVAEYRCPEVRLQWTERGWKLRGCLWCWDAASDQHPAPTTTHLAATNTACDRHHIT